MAKPGAQMAVGTYEGTGAAITVDLGFLPDWVRIVNVEDGDDIHEFYRGMTDDTSIQISTAVALNAADGITLNSGSATVEAGFTVGTDVSESGKTFRYVALASV